ncbi:2-polyprenyl-3-methyl-6-methoxy-1,4-benzoquinone monooxygenase [uncultured Pseudacidovorax sp.]|uniref:2-polyprenyl-3-methyl-6-methoxy-1,4-benzoquinone monooxygenase n=1 Tax=uncultured Pseudacidovorax sp. TaxID=679313 RepID=UPI0025F909C9|nr:2-polyprenyl-3-methyl-6-methoxy-1,4-benzoquinone monooxygenase [uncultured Pseudacidovorax sp.]
MPNSLDTLLEAADSALRTIWGNPAARLDSPAKSAPSAESALSAADRSRSGALMRVNHVGEVCAQGLYNAQALTTSDPALRSQMLRAAEEETDHLRWTRDRLDSLGARPSLLNPLWYGGAFTLGLLAGRMGDAWSLGFVRETERQVEAHLDGHLDRLPPADVASRAVVERMKADEAAHAAWAQEAGARPLPPGVSTLMRMAARVMTTVAYRI